ncbi:MAG: ABC transporter ATP-binding protein [Spirochaetes bacterium]|nr:ABC transporter ATP-binding protein [Spirochaetota bacterium]
MTRGVKMIGLCKSFTVAGKKIDVLKDFSASFPEERVTVLLGKSGCGKTTLIRIIAGLEDFGGGKLEKPQCEKIGIVFQEPRLMPWLTVAENIAFGKKTELGGEKIAKIIELVNLAGFERAYPHQLSGGMQQRAAIARTLMHDPEMILMDEPFASLDYFIRETLQNKLIEIHRATGKSVVFVTHSVDEALILGHKIIVIGEGRVQKEFDLTACPYPRDLLCEELIAAKKEVLAAIKQTESLPTL